MVIRKESKKATHSTALRGCSRLQNVNQSHSDRKRENNSTKIFAF